MRESKNRGNGLGELSQNRRNARKRLRLEFQENRMDLQTIIADAMKTGKKVTITAMGVYENEVHVGVIDRVDVISRRLRLICNYETIWIPLGDIVEVTDPK